MHKSAHIASIMEKQVPKVYKLIKYFISIVTIFNFYYNNSLSLIYSIINEIEIFSCMYAVHFGIVAQVHVSYMAQKASYCFRQHIHQYSKISIYYILYKVNLSKYKLEVSMSHQINKNKLNTVSQFINYLIDYKLQFTDR